MNIDDLLQARISLLESGESLGACLQGIPPEVAPLLELVEKLRQVDWPQLNPDVAAAQRARLMSMSFSPLKERSPKTAPRLSKPLWKRWDGMALALSVGSLLIVCAMLVVSIGGAWFVNRQKQAGTGQPSTVSHSPGEALVTSHHGYVTIRDGNQWQLLSNVRTPLKVGMQIRTGDLSSATLVLYDGSQVHLGPNAELAVEELNAPIDDGPRRVIFSQLSGSSEHEVAHSQDADSVYEVRTPSAAGAALGTIFKVQVGLDQRAWFSVLEGQVAVTGNQETVVVKAGEITVAALDQPPAEPEFFFYGTGEVDYRGETWVIAGQVLATHADTVVTGNPLEGDQVYFEGRLLPDGTRLVDRIVLLRRSPGNHFSITGTVSSTGDPIWVVNGQDISVTEITDIRGNIEQGDLVLVEGIVLPDGALQAEKIQKLDDLPGLPFEMSGIIEEFIDPDWVISGVTIQTNEDTLQDDGLAAGDLVRVTGWILEDGSWLAQSILRQVDETRSFEFTGRVSSLDPWIVAGIELEVREWTHIDADIDTGSQVRVTGQVLEDGAWLAYEITLLEETGESRFVFVGVLNSLQPWTVSGITLNVDADTSIQGVITLGMLVRVEVQILPDGTWKVLSITPAAGFTWGLGCHEMVGRLLIIADGSIQLEGWPAIPLSEDAVAPAETSPNTIVLLQICFSEDGSAQVVYLIVLFQLPVDEIEELEVPELPNEKVMVCHKPNGKNPHTIVISRSAVPAHIGHGDTLGTCP